MNNAERAIRYFRDDPMAFRFPGGRKHFEALATAYEKLQQDNFHHMSLLAEYQYLYARLKNGKGVFDADSNLAEPRRTARTTQADG